MDQGTGAAVLGHPANSVIRLAKMLSALGEEVKAGQIILTGGITKALAVKAGDTVSTRIEELGEVSFRAV
jgi:2-oxo-3-hexenedioate decarboxylase